MMTNSPSTAGRVVWLFGLPSSGKTTLATALCDELRAGGLQACIIDGDMLRSGLNQDLGFSDADRSENLRRASHIARMLIEQGVIVIAAFVTPKEAYRELIRSIIGPENLRMIHVNCPLDVCVARDVKGLYAKALGNRMQGMTGVQDSFEPPVAIDLSLPTSEIGIAEATTRLLDMTRTWLAS